MKTLTFSNEYFNVRDTLYCGQIFRFFEHDKGFIVLSKDKVCYLYHEQDSVKVLCEDENEQYFLNYFDSKTNYADVFSRATKSEFEILKKSAILGKGVRILKQDSVEMLFSFLISQNNNIPRIKGSINKICERLGERKSFLGFEYYTFPTAKVLSEQTQEFYKECGLGYRAPYFLGLANSINDGFLQSVAYLTGENLRTELLKIKGIGEKVANCVLLFGFNQTNRFPVDVWIKNIYQQDFNGTLTDEKKITEYFVNLFGDYSGYFQQYLFYFKRSLEKNQNN